MCRIVPLLPASPPPEATARAAHVSAVSFARKRTVRGASFT